MPSCPTENLKSQGPGNICTRGTEGCTFENVCHQRLVLPVLPVRVLGAFGDVEKEDALFRIALGVGIYDQLVLSELYVPVYVCVCVAAIST